MDRRPPLVSPQAVGADERLRAFFADDSLSAGLLFRCKDANVGLEAPLGELGSLHFSVFNASGVQSKGSRAC